MKLEKLFLTTVLAVVAVAGVAGVWIQEDAVPFAHLLEVTP